jgi:hypothetical protein
MINNAHEAMIVAIPPGPIALPYQSPAGIS